MIPLDVVLSSSVPYSGGTGAIPPDLHIGSELLDDLQFSATAPGGYESCSFNLRRPLTYENAALSQFAYCNIIDTSSLAVVWSGRLEQPGRGSDNIRAISAIGPALYEDTLRAVVYVDQSTARWERIREDLAKDGQVTADDGTDENELDDAHIVMKMPRSDIANLDLQDGIIMRYPLLAECRQRLARFRATAQQLSPASVQWVVEAYGYGMNVSGASGTTLLDSGTFSTGPHDLLARLGTEFSGSFYGVGIRQRWTGASNTTMGTAVRSVWKDIAVHGNRVDITGADAAVSTTKEIDMWRIIEDVFGRYLLGSLDTSTSVVDHAAIAQIEQLVYDSPVPASTIFDDLMLVAPAWYWAGWEQSQLGKHRYEWRSWPTQVDMTTDVSAGWSNPGSGNDLFNEVAVKWVDKNDRPRVTIRTSNAALLRGLTRRGYIDIGTSMATTAQNVGDAFLAAHARPINTGQLLVNRPVYSRSAGRSLMPWEIKPGKLISVRNVPWYRDALNTGQPDGETTFQITQTSFSAKDGVATLTLDSYGSTVVKALRRLTKRVARLNRP